MVMGQGEPLFIGHGDRKRLWADGAGLCSPGLWPPERRTPQVGVARRLNEGVQCELKRWSESREGGLPKALADLAAGRIVDNPFPE